MAVRGYAAPEVRESFVRARELCDQLGDTSQLPAVLDGLSTIAEVGGHYREAYEIHTELIRMADT